MEDHSFDLISVTLRVLMRTYKIKNSMVALNSIEDTTEKTTSEIKKVSAKQLNSTHSNLTFVHSAFIQAF